MADGASAGALLRAAREKQGLHIAALAAAIKVTPKKLEALEADRWDELSGAIFTRALAQSVCRVLRIDPKPVLALLPQPEAQPLDTVTGTLNAPFRGGDGRDDRVASVVAQRTMVGTALLLLVAAGVLFLLPPGFWRSAPVLAGAVPGAPPLPTAAAPNEGTAVMPTVAAVSTPAAAADAASATGTATGSGSGSGSGPTGAAPGLLASGVSGAPLAPVPVEGATAVTPTAPAAATAAAPTAAPTAAPPAGSLAAPSATPPAAPAVPVAATAAAATARAGTLRIEASAPSWVEVRERGGRVLLSRQLAAQESVGVDGAFPLALTVGNAAGTKVTLRGAPLDLVAVARNNVARIEVP